MFNMFIMKEKYFNRYCEWLFNILKDVENSIDINDYSKQEKRVFGYLSEMLMDVWIDENNILFVENKWGMIGSQHLIKRSAYLILRKFKLVKGKTHF